jgi:uncharacterized membrane protein
VRRVYRDRMVEAAARREGGTERIIGLTDGVAAIAITLVALPLVDVAADVAHEGLAGWFAREGYALIAAAVSFASIAGYWRDHHALYRRVTGTTRLSVRLNFTWLAAIVFLPVATVLLVRAPKRDLSALALYIVLLCVTIALLNLQELELLRAGAIDPERRPSPRELASRWVPIGVRLLALAGALLIPALGLWSLLLVVIGPPVQWLVRGTIGTGQR